MSKKRARNDGMPGMPLVALCPVASDPMTPASVPSLRVKYQPLYLERERKFKESKALFAFPISIDMVSESSVMTTFEDNMKQKSTTFEDNIKQKCDPGCNARKILEYVHNKPDARGRHSTVGKLKAQTKAAEFVRKSMVCVRSQPTLSADEASPLSRLQGNNNFVFVVAHCNRMHLYTTGDGEYVQVMLDPTLTSFVPKESLNPVSMSYSMFVKFWHPEEIEMIEKHFTRVNHISVAQLHRFVPVVPTHKQLDEFQAGVGPPTDLCQQSNSVLWWVDPKYKFGDPDRLPDLKSTCTSTAVAHQDTAPVVLQDKAQVRRLPSPIAVPCSSTTDPNTTVRLSQTDITDREVDHLMNEIDASGDGAWSGNPIRDTSCCYHPLTDVPYLRPGPRRDHRHDRVRRILGTTYERRRRLDEQDRAPTSCEHWALRARGRGWRARGRR